VKKTFFAQKTPKKVSSFSLVEIFGDGWKNVQKRDFAFGKKSTRALARNFTTLLEKNPNSS